MTKKLWLLSLVWSLQAFSQQVVPGEYIVRYKKPLKGVEVISKTLSLAKVTVKKDQIRTFSEAEVEWWEPNYMVYALKEPNDPRFSELYGLQKLEAVRAWDETTGSSKVKVAVIDTGIDYNHPDLKENVVGKGFNAADPKKDGFDDQGHGTHCAGTIAAVGNNAIGVVGVNWDASLYPAKFLDKNGSGTTADAIRAIEWAINQGVDVMSNSWGGGGSSRALEEVIGKACDKGIAFVAAAGNDGANIDKSPTYPASYDLPCVISVAATTQKDELAYFSNYGFTVDVAAPGYQILSTLPGNKYGAYSGTSMATPHVSGVIAAMLSVSPDLSPEKVKTLLQQTADAVTGDQEERAEAKCSWWKKLLGKCPKDPSPPAERKPLGGGRVNMRKAIEASR